MDSATVRKLWEEAYDFADKDVVDHCREFLGDLIEALRLSFDIL